ncbi:hypothetical protein HY478_02425 [Candidatus Uhrbacteria bacterium]|nr:hypothetical protein [Candidatus Uhrbacteria bacterium]
MCNREIKFGAFYRFTRSHGADAIAMGHYRSGEKDQSYFLWAVPKEILASTIFPVGNMEKSGVRALAKRFNLPVTEKKDSQGVCFLGPVSLKEFLKKELGDDNPALLYTLGQRASLPEGPWYVVGKDVREKKILVSKARLPAQAGTSAACTIHFTDANWFSDLSGPLIAQYRYRGPRVEGMVEGHGFVSYEPLPEVYAPGQSIVFYRGRALVGGGIIEG